MQNKGQHAIKRVDIWRVNIPKDGRTLPKWWVFLSEQEQLRAHRYRILSDRNTFIITRGVLRVLLGRYLDSAPDKIRFHIGAHGKLQLAEAADLYFNVSHTLGLSLLAFTRIGAIGVDVERSNRPVDALAIAARCFTRKEQSQLYALTAAERPAAFLRYWVRKEAYIKALGLGLITTTGHIDVNAASIGAWQLHMLDLKPPYLGALCARRDYTCCYYDYQIEQ